MVRRVRDEQVALGIEDGKVGQRQSHGAHLISKHTDSSTWCDLQYSGLADITDKKIAVPIQGHACRSTTRASKFRHCTVWRQLTNHSIGATPVDVIVTIHCHSFRTFESRGWHHNLIKTALLIRLTVTPFSCAL